VPLGLRAQRFNVRQSTLFDEGHDARKFTDVEPDRMPGATTHDDAAVAPEVAAGHECLALRKGDVETGRTCAVRRGHRPVVAARGPSGERARRSVAAKRAVQQTTRPAGEDPQGSLRAGTAGQDPGFADWFDPRSRPHAEQCIAAGLLMGRRPAHQAAATGLRQWGHRRSSSSTCPPHVGQRHALAAAVPSGCITSGLAAPRRVLGLQVAVFGGAFGLAASAFSFARFCSHCSFLMARLRRCLRRVRGSCGVPMVGRVLPQDPRCVLGFFCPSASCVQLRTRDEVAEANAMGGGECPYFT